MKGLEAEELRASKLDTGYRKKDRCYISNARGMSATVVARVVRQNHRAYVTILAESLLSLEKRR